MRNFDAMESEVERLRMIQYLLYLSECHEELIESLMGDDQEIDCHEYLLSKPMYAS